MSKQCAIIGAGASGLVAAIEAARRGADVTVFEKNSKCGRKLLATGNGRCNITNTSLGLEHFHSHSVDAMEPILGGFDAKACIEYFRTLGIEIVETDGGKCYPMSLQARTVVEFLTFTCKELGVSILLETEVLHVEKENDSFLIKTVDETKYFDSLLIATGSIATPSLGSSESGLKFAEYFGHSVYPTFASLVQLVTVKNLKNISGVKLYCNASVVVDGKVLSKCTGDVLFANYGLSGLAILDLSRDVAFYTGIGCKVEICLDLFPEMSKEALKGLFQRRMKLFPLMSLQRWLEGVVHHRLAHLILDELNLDATLKVDSKILNQLVHKCKTLNFEISSTRGSLSAEVMAGGVVLDEINPNTMSSLKVKGLYFSGEVLDVDGDRGGYNLHFAWASGIKAGRMMVN